MRQSAPDHERGGYSCLSCRGSPDQRRFEYWADWDFSKRGSVAAISVGLLDETTLLDLDYSEDSEAETDMNVVMNNGGGFIEVQGTAEGHAMRRDELDALLHLATQGTAQLFELQRAALGQ